MEQGNKKAIIIAFCILILGILITVGALFINKKANQNSSVMQEARDKNDAEQQIAKLTKEVNEGTKDTEAKRNLARAYYLVGDINNSEKFIKEALAVNEKLPQYYVDLGLIYQSKGDLAGAEEQFKKAIELNTKEYPDPILADFPTSKQEELSKRFPPIVYKLPSPYTQLARLYMSQNRIAEAISILQVGTTVLPNYPDFYLMLSELYKDINTDKSSAYRRQFEQLLKGETITTMAIQ